MQARARLELRETATKSDAEDVVEIMKHRWTTGVFVCTRSATNKIKKNAYYNFLKPKVMLFNSLFCPTDSPKLKTFSLLSCESSKSSHFRSSNWEIFDIFTCKNGLNYSSIINIVYYNRNISLIVSCQSFNQLIVSARVCTYHCKWYI